MPRGRLLPLVPTEQLWLAGQQVVAAVGEPGLRAPGGSVRAEEIRRAGDRQAGPYRIEVKEEKHRDAKMIGDQQPSTSWLQLLSQLREHECEGQDHEDESAE